MTNGVQGLMGLRTDFNVLQEGTIASQCTQPWYLHMNILKNNARSNPPPSPQN